MLAGLPVNGNVFHHDEATRPCIETLIEAELLCTGQSS
ncbi:Unknown protein sequence [Pseudomonas syringae pv. cilantro]|uniref:Uncharacterized protein n=1 Tax=Pseudomonas syringae pv. cilantro TaxID=81035 RepID=A0A0N0GE89_PSESX|nr:Unknown protein sequence [Pseudomonas syringae pv. cilantro]